MDIIEKLKRYQAAGTVPRPRTAILPTELYSQLGGNPLTPDFPAAIRMVKEYPFTFFLPEPQQHFGSSGGSFIYLPVLTRREFAERFSLSDIVLFDLETTGLAGGTGTYPFLLGFGIFTENGIEIIQYFLPDYGLENAAFLELIKSFSGAKILVSFNGKSFDYPILNNRFILNRLENPFKSCRHLDLLHPARRVWKTLLESCSLNNIETRIFSFSRVNDVPGALIPQIYFEFIRAGNTGDILRVLEHNQQDILTLGRLLFHFNWLENIADQQSLHEQELQNLCNVAISNLDLDRSEMLLEQIRKKGNLPSDLTLTAFSLLLKRSGKWEQAESIWHELIRLGKNTLFANEELAKYYEHHKTDLVQAKFYTEQALEYLDIMDELTTATADTDTDHNEQSQFRHRLQRLRQKIAQSGQKKNT
jgi:uncharacterized protein YprB with RNaseH-like and TPR domain